MQYIAKGYNIIKGYMSELKKEKEEKT